MKSRMLTSTVTNVEMEKAGTKLQVGSCLNPWPGYIFDGIVMFLALSACRATPSGRRCVLVADDAWPFARWNRFFGRAAPQCTSTGTCTSFLPARPGDEATAVAAGAVVATRPALWCSAMGNDGEREPAEAEGPYSALGSHLGGEKRGCCQDWKGRRVCTGVCARRVFIGVCGSRITAARAQRRR